MSKPISEQANKLWQIVTAPGTIDSYKQAVVATWTILKESAILIWLTFCLILVAFDWFWDNSIATGRRVRAWVNGFDRSDTSQVASQMGKGALAAGKISLDYVVTQARAQVGLAAKPVSLEASAEPSPPAISPAQSTPAQSNQSTPAQSTPAQSTPAQSEQPAPADIQPVESE